MKPTFFEISIELFQGCSVMVFVNYDGKKLRSAYRRWKCPEAQIRAVEALAAWWDNHVTDPSGLAGCAQSTPEGPIVLLNLQDGEPLLVTNIIAHEMLHAAWFVMSAASIKINEHTEEVLAYLVGFLTSKTMTGIGRFASPKKKK